MNQPGRVQPLRMGAGDITTPKKESRWSQRDRQVGECQGMGTYIHMPCPKLPKALPSCTSLPTVSPGGLLLQAHQAWAFGVEGPSLSTGPPRAAFPGAMISLKQREGRPHLQLPCYPSPTPIYCAFLGPSRGPEVWPGLLPSHQRLGRWPQDLSPQHTALLQRSFLLARGGDNK